MVSVHLGGPWPVSWTFLACEALFVGSESQVELVGDVEVLEEGKKLQFRFQETLAFRSSVGGWACVKEGIWCFFLLQMGWVGVRAKITQAALLLAFQSFMVHNAHHELHVLIFTPRFNFPLVHPKAWRVFMKSSLFLISDQEKEFN